MTPEQLDIAAAAAFGFVLYKVARSRSPAEIGEPVLPPVGREGAWDAFWHPKREPIPIGDAKTEFYETHMRLLAMSGGYKTTLLAQLVRHRIRKGRPVVVLAGGDADQVETEIRAAGGLVIRPEDSPYTFNTWEGTPAFMAQSWAQLFPTNSEAKVYHGAFELVAMRYFQSTTSYSVAGLKDFVLNYNPTNADGEEVKSRLYEGMKDGYVQIRLERVEQFLGHWIGDQLSISYCIKHKIPVMFVVDSADAPDLNELAAALVWQGICYGVREHGTKTGADVFVDEFGRLPVGLVSNQIRTWRRNKSHLVAASHTDRDFDPILEDMFHVNVLGRMVASATNTRKAASEMTWGAVHPTGFGPHALGERRSRLNDIKRDPRRGYFWLVDQVRVQEVKVLQYQPPKVFKPVHVIPGLAATRKKAIRPTVGPATSKGPEPRSLTPIGGGVRDVEPMQGPPECPPIFLQPFATDREMKIWLQHRFPKGIEGDWELDYYCNPGTGRPEMQWRGSPYKPFTKGKFVPGVSGGNSWMAYMVVLALWEIYDRGWVLDSKEAADYLWELKEQTVRMGVTVGHRDTGADLGLCHSRKCGKREHMKWLTNRDNVSEQKMLIRLSRRVKRKGVVA